MDSTPPAGTDQGQALIGSAIRTIKAEAEGVAALADALGAELGTAFIEAVRTISLSTGRVIVSGLGKSGHIAGKIAATLASTGTPAFFVHAGEARHGDLGMITADDVILAVSWSGETPELTDIIEYSRRFSVPLIALTGAAGSALGRAGDITLAMPRADEACPHGLAPTTSTTMQLALGDALAVSLLEARGFTADQFKNFHPGGRLGAQLTFVRDVMHAGDDMPLAPPGLPMSEVLVIMTAKRLGCVGIVDGAGHLAGIITDGDLRRKMHPQLLAATAGEVMTPGPKAVSPATLASKALELINASQITSLFVVEAGRPVGVVHLHDLLRIGVA
ncbi:MAG: KpsF/GutQ family sugar-phosphate isomerase [Rhizobiales bacterium]|nr:KpsF/GutQ family sugar-phosphate isomerase [Hyphomicrobiales bacterium]